MLNSSKVLWAVLQALEVSEATLQSWRAQFGEMKAEGAARLERISNYRAE
jgi:hypothetical protein